LITQPRMLILDEPTEGIQPSVVSEIEETILSLTSRGGLSILLVEQHVGFALGRGEPLLRAGSGPGHFCRCWWGGRSQACPGSHGDLRQR
jgi:urea transport system ATP-binding protein